MPKNYFKNHEAFWQGARKVEKLYKWAVEAEDSLGKNPDMKYDSRNLYSLALLVIDMKGIPEAAQESHFKAEYAKMHQAFNTPHPDTPNKADPEAIKPYIRAMFDNVKTDLSAMDTNDPEQVEDILKTMLATQMLATMVVDYPIASMELYPTHEDKIRIDTVSAKAYAFQLEARSAMSYEGLDEIGRILTVGRNPAKSTSHEIQWDLINAVYGATEKGSDTVVIDPTSTELSSKFFMKKKFSLENDVGDGPEEFTEKDYARCFGDHLASIPMNSSFEYQVLKTATGHSDTIEKEDVLVIGGRSMSQIVSDYTAQGLGYPDKYIAAGRFLRDSLLKGDPVTLVTSSFSKDGEIIFRHRDIKLDLDKLDLDKLNAQDRKANYNIFRRMLHKIGLWTIPKKYPTNAERDAKVSALLADPDSAHQKQLKSFEAEFVRSYNAVDRSGNNITGCGLVIPHLTVKEATAEIQPREEAVEQADQRQRIEGINLEADKELPVEPIKEADEKVIKTEPLAK